ncbi:ARF GTPase-activating protein GIT2-like isoform X3 [Eriocheir sinensis]|uniref:ARF GTPase-activating protein GIT2-like isoform X3 n=1 Tax=Eriocheir sinensis TaxID=95602 RepID=UPI0021CACA16|nr:ARF GTPase-activating protein GIT2-like isoform X3 [Eriocheir sinensis]
MSRVGAGARTKPRGTQDVCGDCGAPDPGWASINRGILICDECCSVHRSLGRHISQVKSLKKGSWNAIQHAMVHTLYNSGANGIWEHTLLDPSVAKTGRRKPHPKDPVHPTKADFIRAKHQMLSFVYRPSRDENNEDDADVSRQLHSSVRTSNLETSLRLLSQGADPNYFHKEKNCCPLHVAARAGQSSQVELLIVYGADPGAVDPQGYTPAHYGSEANHPELAGHLIECQYELTDRLAFYVSGRKPDHENGQHWIIPEMADSLDVSDLAKEARAKLQSLPNHLFEDLACDVYDEVDRRETDSIWLSLQNPSALVSDRCTVPFLPVNPEYSSTRNQGRQKLARFNAREFATLIIDVLSEAKRRQAGIPSPLTTPKDKVTQGARREARAHDPSLASPSPPTLQPLQPQDSFSMPSMPVHSDPSMLGDSSSGTTSTSALLTDIPCTNASAATASDTSSSAPASLSYKPHANNNNKGEMTDDGEPLYDSVASEDDYTYVEQVEKLNQQKKFLEEEQKRQLSAELLKYSEMRSEMESGVNLEKYLEMKEKLESSEVRIQELQSNNAHMRSQLDELCSTVQNLREENKSLRSLYSSGSMGGSMGQSTHSTPPPLAYYQHPHCLHNGDADPQVNVRSRGPPVQRPFSMFEPRQGPPSVTAPCHPLDQARTSAFSGRVSGEYDNTRTHSPGVEPSEMTPLNSSYGIPTQEEVVKKTEVITKKIQELLISAQEGRQEAFMPCAEQIHAAVLDMDSIFPKGRCPSGVQGALRQLVNSANRLLGECRSHVLSHAHSLDPKFVTQQVIQCAYDIAKGAKALVSHFQ